MLTPEYLTGCTDYLLGLYDELERAVVADIARRIAKTGRVTSTADWQAMRAQESGALLNDVIKQVSATTGASTAEVRRLFNEAGITGMKNDLLPLMQAGLKVDLRLSPAQSDVLQATIQKTNGALTNLTMTTGVTATGAYMEATNAAYMKVQSGAFTPAQAIRSAIQKAAIDGNWVMYDSGARSRLDVAVRRSVLTGINQTCAKITDMTCDDLECDFVEVSAHAGARPSHSLWQGQVYKREGSTMEYENLYDATGLGEGDGLCGWNCRHSYYPFFMGISKRAYSHEDLEWMDSERYEYDGERLTEYEVSQLMRRNERGIREIKRELAGYKGAMDVAPDRETEAELRAAFDTASMKLKDQEARYRSICTQTHHRPDSTRTAVVATTERGRIVSFSRSEAQTARRSAERQYNRRITDTGAKGAAPSTVFQYMDIKYSNNTERRLVDHYMRNVESGRISPLATYANYKVQREAVEKQIVGMVTQNGITITDGSKHLIDRMMGTMNDPDELKKTKGESGIRNGVSVAAIRVALANPLKKGKIKVRSDGLRSQKFIGVRGTVSVNVDTGVLIQCNPTDRDRRRRLSR